MRFFNLSKDSSFQRRKLEFEAERTWRTASYTIRLKEEIFDQTLNSGSRGREGRTLKSGIPSRQETDEGFWKVLSSRMMLASFFLFPEKLPVWVFVRFIADRIHNQDIQGIH